MKLGINTSDKTQLRVIKCFKIEAFYQRAITPKNELQDATTRNYIF